MKKIILLGFASLSLMFNSCEKEDLNPANYNEDDTVTSNEINQDNLKAALVVYGSMSCELPNGEVGCECIIVQDNDDCSMQTECTAVDRLPNYNRELKAMFTTEEIAQRASKSVRITEPILIQMLEKDGFPIKGK